MFVYEVYDFFVIPWTFYNGFLVLTTTRFDASHVTKMPNRRKRFNSRVLAAKVMVITLHIEQPVGKGGKWLNVRHVRK